MPTIAQTTTAQMRRLLRKLDRGLALARSDNGFRAGATPVPDTLITALLSQDLIIADGGHRYVISEPGRAYLRRAESDRDDNFKAQQQLLAEAYRLIDCKRQKVSVNLAESPLAWLKRRNLVSAAQFEAGERLRSDFLKAGQDARVTMAWDAPPMGRVLRGAPDHLDPTMAQLAAKRRFEAAIAAAGPGLADILWRVVCAGEGLETAEKAMAWPIRTAKVVLGLALDRLVTFYRI